MNRMNMSKMGRRYKARDEICKVMFLKYGSRWTFDQFYDPEILGTKLVHHWNKVCGYPEGNGLPPHLTNLPATTKPTKATVDTKRRKPNP